MVGTAGYEYTQPHARTIGNIVFFYFCIIHDSASAMKGGAVSGRQLLYGQTFCCSYK